MSRARGNSSYTADVIQLGKEKFNEINRFINTYPYARGRTCYGANGC